MKINFGRSEFLLLALGTGAALTLFLAGCAQQTDSNANSFTQVYNASFSVTCMNCHSSTSVSPFMDFSSADSAYSALVGQNVVSPSNPSVCGGVKRVAAGDATNSYLLAILFPQDNRVNFGGSSGCQAPTSHHSSVNLTDAERSSIVAWISAGAAR